MTRLALRVASASDRGRVRGHNEDFIRVEVHAGLAVLADGMGGHNAGEVASRMAVDAVVQGLTAQQAIHGSLSAAEAEALVEAQLAAANAIVFEAARSERRYEGMGTTLVLALWHEGGVTYGHVGDSRLYLLRDRQLARLTRDHSIVQEQLERGAITSDQARHSAHRNVLTRAVGLDPYVAADVRTIAVRPNDLYLLCSDGLTEMMTDAEICQTLLESGGDLPGAVDRLVQRANDAGGVDNISVILAHVEPEAP